MSAALLRVAHMNLLQKTHKMERYSLLAVDGVIGSVEELYFDEATWAVRYLVVNTGGWLKGRHVLISPVAVGEVDEEQGTINVELTRDQIENSPPVSANRPVSRQYEVEYYQYYDWTPYWVFGPLGGYPMSGTSMATPPTPGEVETPGTPGKEDTHLHSTAEVNGYAIAAQDGDIGHVDDFIVDIQYWVIRYLEIDTRNWWPGKHVLVNPDWIEDISWTEHTVSLDLNREAIKGAPGFDHTKEINRDFETRLFRYYGRPGYWRTGNQ